VPVRSIDEIKSFVVGFATRIPRNILANIIPMIEQIALNRSPSSAFMEAYNLAVIYAPSYELAVAKITRWIAVAKRDYGEQEALRLLSILKSLAQSSAQPSHSPQVSPPGTVTPAPHNIQQNIVIAYGVVPGVYRYGKYDWLAQSRLEKLSELLKRRGLNLPSELSQFTIEVFYSMYLLNTELASERIESNLTLKTIAILTQPIREDDELRRLTILDEDLSLTLTAEMLAKILQNKQLLSKLAGVLAICGSCSTQQQAEELAKAVEELKEAIKNAKPAHDEAEKMKKSLAIGGKLAGKFKGKLDFADRVEIAKILADHPVMVEHILRYLKTSEEPGRKGDTIDFVGYRKMERYTELAKLRITELAYPEDLFLQRLATKSVDVRRYEEGTTGRKRKYVVVIDKSGSMSGEKIEWAKAVALSLLLRSDTDDVKVIFFDYAPYESIDFSKNLVEALRKITTVKANGGTSIDAALKKADEFNGYDIVLITDGEDTVTYKPRNRLFSVMVYGDNETLKSVSTKYTSIRELSVERVVETLS